MRVAEVAILIAPLEAAEVRSDEAYDEDNELEREHFIDEGGVVLVGPIFVVE